MPMLMLLIKFWKAIPSWIHFQFTDFVHKFNSKVREEMGKKHNDNERAEQKTKVGTKVFGGRNIK